VTERDREENNSIHSMKALLREAVERRGPATSFILLWAEEGDVKRHCEHCVADMLGEAERRGVEAEEA